MLIVFRAPRFCGTRKTSLDAARTRDAVTTPPHRRHRRPSQPRYGRYGCRKIAALLRPAGCLVNNKRVERIWQR